MARYVLKCVSDLNLQRGSEGERARLLLLISCLISSARRHGGVVLPFYLFF